MLRCPLYTLVLVSQGGYIQIIAYFFDVRKQARKTRFYGQSGMPILAMQKRRATIGKIGIIGYSMLDVRFFEIGIYVARRVNLRVLAATFRA